MAALMKIPTVIMKVIVKYSFHEHFVRFSNYVARIWKRILLVSSSKHADRWVVPGGGIEPLEDPRLAAVREALEEAGAKGHMGRMLGVFENKEKKHRTLLYAFIVTDLLDEWEDGIVMGRQRKWFDIKEAREYLSHKPVQATYLEHLNKDLNGIVK